MWRRLCLRGSHRIGARPLRRFAHPRGEAALSVPALVLSPSAIEALSCATNPDDFALTFRGVSRGTNTVDAPRPQRPGGSATPAAAEPEEADLDLADDGPGLQLDRKR